MSIFRYLLGGLMVGGISLLYNYLAFSLLKVYPDLSSSVSFFRDIGLSFYMVVFLKNFLVGLILMVLFTMGYNHIIADKGEGKDLGKAVFFFSLYAIFALISFSLGDMILMRSQEGLLLLVTVDGFIETFVATVPVRLFHRK